MGRPGLGSIVCAFATACSSFGAAGDAPSTDHDAAAEAGGGSCTALFCSSFDDATFQVGWDGYLASGTASSRLEKSADRPADGPFLLRWSTDAGTRNGEQSYLFKDVGNVPAGKGVSLDLRVRLTTPNPAPNDGIVEAISVGWGEAGQTYPVREALVRVVNQSLLAHLFQVEVPNVTTRRDDTITSIAAPDAEWHRLRVEVTFPPSGQQHAAFFFDDGVAPFAARDFDAGPSAMGRVRVVVGGGYVNGHFDAMTLDFDQVTLRAM